MELKKMKNHKHPVRNVLIRILICVGILLIGFAVMAKLSSLKKPPAEATVRERAMRIEAQKAVPEDVPVFITGYGEIAALNVVAISPEVSGRIVHIHPRLETGEVIPKGETLFKIDDRNYKAALDEVRALVSQMKTSVTRLEKQYQLDRERQKTVERNRELAKNEYERVKRLFKVNKVGTQSGVDKTEQAYNSAVDAADQMARLIALYPIQIKEAESGLASARARMTLARANFDRCRVKAPFDGRLKNVTLEINQFVSPGQLVLSLADDSVIEILVPIDSRDARKWLQFKSAGTNAGATWFTGLEQLPCQIRWTENPEEHIWEGRLHRVVSFKPQTRTLTVAVRIDADAAAGKNPKSLPLVEGMFCSVRIPGRKLENVIRLPRWAVTFDNTVYVANGENRLKTVPVTVARTEGETIYVSAGLNPGDTVITTRLIDPLENALLEVELSRLKAED